MVLGRVKWFNAKAGYGFATSLAGGVDVFVHHSGLKVSKEQFRYLVEGEYIEMTITEKDGKSTGTDVTGVQGGKLMCETRAESSAQVTEKKKPNVIQQLKYKPKNEL